MTEPQTQCGCSVSEHISKRERNVLIIALTLNAGMFIAEFSAGILSHSTALLADSLDMLADALVYAIGLYAIGRSTLWRTRAALTNGSLQLLLGMGVLIEVYLKLSAGIIPGYETMGIFGVLALVVNTISFMLLLRYKEGDINMRATWLCTRNDMLANIGVLVAAYLVYQFQSLWPDIIIGLIIAAIVIHSAGQILLEAKNKPTS